MAEQYRARMAGMTPAQLNNYIKFLYINQRDAFLQIMPYLKINDMLAVCKADVDVEFYNACNNDPAIWDYYATTLRYYTEKNPIGLPSYKAVGDYVYLATKKRFQQFQQMSLSRQLIVYTAALEVSSRTIGDFKSAGHIYPDIYFSLHNYGPTQLISLRYQLITSGDIDTEVISYFSKMALEDVRILDNAITSPVQRSVIKIDSNYIELQLVFRENPKAMFDRLLILFAYFLDTKKKTTRLMEHKMRYGDLFSGFIRSDICHQCQKDPPIVLCQTCDKQLCKKCLPHNEC